MTGYAIFDDINCLLGEGPLWHPERQELFWFDIPGKKLLWHRSGATEVRGFSESVSAAGWIDYETLLIASETALLRYDIAAHESEMLVALEADRPEMRSNDGRADPHGGFWIGTMSKAEVKAEGAIYRFYRGELRQLYSGLLVPNAICFAPDGTLAYFTDTRTQKVMRQKLDGEGWPKGDPELFIDMTTAGLRPDGAVVDAAGHFWNAQFGGGQVAEYDTDGTFLRSFPLPAKKTTCPAFIGPDYTSLVCTTAAVGTEAEGAVTGEYPDGRTFLIEGVGPGLPEYRVAL